MPYFWTYPRIERSTLMHHSVLILMHEIMIGDNNNIKWCLSSQALYSRFWPLQQFTSDVQNMSNVDVQREKQAESRLCSNILFTLLSFFSTRPLGLCQEIPFWTFSWTSCPYMYSTSLEDVPRFCALTCPETFFYTNVPTMTVVNVLRSLLVFAHLICANTSMSRVSSLHL